MLDAADKSHRFIVLVDSWCFERVRNNVGENQDNARRGRKKSLEKKFGGT